MDLDNYLSEIQLFPISENEYHLYLGDPNHPRSSMVIIRGQRISAPRRVPPMSKPVLVGRYPDVEMDPDRLFPRVRMILCLLHQIPNIFEGGNESVLRSWENYNWEAGIDSPLPVTETIETICHSSQDGSDILPLMITLLANPSRSRRQESLTQLIRFNNNTSYCLINYLFWIRPEISISIIRELGRHGIDLGFVKSQCTNYIQTTDKAYQLFSHGYLLQFDISRLEKTEFYASRVLEFERYLRRSKTSRLRNLAIILYGDIHKIDAFHVLVDFDDEELLKVEIRSFLQILDRRKVDLQILRAVIVDLLQYAETSQRSILFGIILSFCSLFDQFAAGNKYQTEIDGAFRHIRNRVLSQIHIWKEQGKKLQIEGMIIQFLSSIPPIEINGSSVPDPSSWFSQHPILKHVQQEIKSVIKKEEALVQIAFNLANMQHDILNQLIKSALSPEITPHLTLSQHLAIFGRFNDELQTPPAFQEGQILREKDLQYIQISPEFLQILSTSEIIVDHSILQKIIKQILASQSDNIRYLVGYFQTVSKINKELLDPAFQILEEEILATFSYDDLDPKTKSIILEVVIPFSSITGTFPSDIVQNTVDTFKIIFQDELEDFDLESSKPLAVDTIVRCYRLTGGEIPKFVESNIQFSFTKPVWDQLARHYLALGIERPRREALAKSKLKEVPNYLIRDVLGQIALVNQTLSYCSRNGFRPPLENLIINNMYKRGWNVERGLERTLPSVLGSISPRLRSYVAAYLVVEQGEVSLDVLRWARDIEDYLIRDRIVRELERYGTPDMWIVVANSYHLDIQQRAIDQLKDSRMSATERSNTIIQLLGSTRKKVMETGLRWLTQYGVQQEHLISLLAIRSVHALPVVCDYLYENRQHLSEEHQHPLYELLREIMWKPRVTRHVRDKVIQLVEMLDDPDLKQALYQNALKLADAAVKSRIIDAITVLSKVGK